MLVSLVANIQCPMQNVFLSLFCVSDYAIELKTSLRLSWVWFRIMHFKFPASYMGDTGDIDPYQGDQF